MAHPVYVGYISVALFVFHFAAGVLTSDEKDIDTCT